MFRLERDGLIASRQSGFGLVKVVQHGTEIEICNFGSWVSLGGTAESINRFFALPQFYKAIPLIDQHRNHTRFPLNGISSRIHGIYWDAVGQVNAFFIRLISCVVLHKIELYIAQLL